MNFSKYRVKPGSKVSLKDWDPSDKSAVPADKAMRVKQLEEISEEINKLQDVLSFGLELIGMAGPEMGADTPLAGAFQEALLYSPSSRIAGGTDEIMKNIIAERVLGLPQDPRVDKNVPFRDIPGSVRK